MNFDGSTIVYLKVKPLYLTFGIGIFPNIKCISKLINSYSVVGITTLKFSVK
jgi:hypothetical protein